MWLHLCADMAIRARLWVHLHLWLWPKGPHSCELFHAHGWPAPEAWLLPPAAQVWHYREADPDLGAWQAKELLDHLEGVLANEPVEVISGQSIVEVKPQVRRRQDASSSGQKLPDWTALHPCVMIAVSSASTVKPPQLGLSSPC